MSLRRSARVQSHSSVANGVNGTESIAIKTKKVIKKLSKSKKSKLDQDTMPPPSTSQTTTTIPNPTEAPQTPRKRRKIQEPSSASPAKPPPFTSTPSAVHLMTSTTPLRPFSYSTGDIDDVTPPPLSPRPVEPHLTNAALATPGGSHVVAYPRAELSSSQQQQQQAGLEEEGLPAPTATTATLLQEACAHLVEVDPRLRQVVERYQCRIFAPEGLAEEVDPFRSLASGIMAQQVSGAAARSIKNKFIALFNPPPSTTEGDTSLHHFASPTFPTPAAVGAADIPFLRTAGLSQRKAEYIQGLAQKFESGELSAQMLVRASDEEVLEKLTAVRGLGRWSVEMFMCFALKRMDVFSTGDLGVQ
ncbi:MAG: hypothetical protein Q9165_000675 [Trypethelium subeluteriae]